jgi:hypothetical protein
MLVTRTPYRDIAISFSNHGFTKVCHKGHITWGAKERKYWFVTILLNTSCFMFVFNVFNRIFTLFNVTILADSNCTFSSFATSPTPSKHPSHTSQAYSNVCLMKARYIFDRICLERVNFSFLRTLTCLKVSKVSVA